MLDFFGGAERDRTADLLNAIQALSQLSYSPKSDCLYIKTCYQCQTYSSPMTHFSSTHSETSRPVSDG